MLPGRFFCAIESGVESGAGAMGEDLIAAMPAIAVRYRAPAPDLRRYVSAYYLFTADLPHVSDTLRADQAQLRFLLAGDGTYSFADGGRVASPQVTLIGPTMGASRFDIAGPVLVLGVGLRAEGWAAIVGDDASRYADGAFDAAALLGPTMTETFDALRGAALPARMADILEAALRVLVARRPAPAHAFSDIVDRWLIESDNPQVDRLVAMTALSARQVERIAGRIYGAPPKLLARKYRALRVAAQLGAGGASLLPDIGDGFYDQSHFIREFKHFTGFTPRQFVRSPSPITVLTLRRCVLEGQPALLAVS